jgi:hypothetical protein
MKRLRLIAKAGVRASLGNDDFQHRSVAIEFICAERLLVSELGCEKKHASGKSTSTGGGLYGI